MKALSGFLTIGVSVPVEMHEDISVNSISALSHTLLMWMNDNLPNHIVPAKCQHMCQQQMRTVIVQEHRDALAVRAARKVIKALQYARVLRLQQF